MNRFQGFFFDKIKYDNFLKNIFSAVNYGKLGSIIGHEIIHAFNNFGCFEIIFNT